MNTYFLILEQWLNSIIDYCQEIATSEKFLTPIILTNQKMLIALCIATGALIIIAVLLIVSQYRLHKKLNKLLEQKPNTEEIQEGE